MMTDPSKLISRRVIDKDTWNRREHYAFFSAMDNPFCGITLKADVGRHWTISKEEGVAFNTVVMHALILAADQVPYMRYRIEDDQIVECEHLDIGGIELRKDDTIGFSYFRYHHSLKGFQEEVIKEQARVQATPGMAMHPKMDPSAVIFYSALPWISFSEMNHASSMGQGRGVLRCSVGRFEIDADGRKMMPVSVTFHHGLVFAYDIHRLIKAFEDYVKA